MVDAMEPLYLDSGNSRLKWRYRSESGVFAEESALQEFVVNRGIVQVVLSSVTTRYTSATVEALVPALKVHKIEVLDNCLGLKLVYEDIAKLGVDRWLNMLAVVGELKRTAHIIVSMGTAMTVDVVDQQNKHIGGYIVPGLTTQLLSLSDRASALPIAEVAGSTELGVNTHECIGHGVLKLSCSLVEVLVREWQGERPVVTVTGGDGPILSESLDVKHELRANLVFEGMRAYWQARKNTLG
jgi:type III pantothenate kinase